jgi:UDP-glucose 4-epimerase
MLNKKINIAIIGGNGFVGKCLTNELIIKRLNTNITIFTRRKKMNVEKKQYPNVKYVEIDLCLKKTYSNHFKDIDVVYFLASDTIPVSSWEAPLKEINENILPFINFMEEIKNKGVKKIIYLSSAGTIYGKSETTITENSKKKPFTPHGIAKLTIEHFLEHYRIKNNIQHDVFRISNIYGPGQDTSKGLGIVNLIIENSLKNKVTNIFGDGSNTRNFIFIDDVINILVHALDLPINKSNIINISSNENYNINKVIKTIESIVKTKANIEYKDNRISDNTHTLISNKKMLKKFAHIKPTSLEEGIRKTFEHLKTKSSKIENHTDKIH